jgi:hypothetical protein
MLGEGTAVQPKIHGSCLCGQIRFLIDGKFGPIGQCHCSKCRKLSGTDGNAVFHTKKSSFHWISGEHQIRTYHPPNQPTWSSSFCATCGSPVPNADSSGDFYYVPAGLLDDDPGFRGYAAHIFVDSKAPWVCITDSAPQFPAGFPAPPAEE